MEIKEGNKFTFMNNEKYNDFIEHKCKAKDIFYIQQIDKETAYNFIRKYHYLKDAKFFCVVAYGLFTKEDNLLVGCATYSNPQGIVALKSWFNLDNQCKNVFELSRLCMLPSLNKTNATSFLLGGSIHEMKRTNNEIVHKLKKEGKEVKPEDYFCRAVTTLACSERHIGSIYLVCNFKYYGLSDSKTDFYTADGKLNPRGKTSDVQGVWLPRARKHRYAYILDKTLKCNYAEVKDLPKYQETIALPCCNGTKKVFDSRFNVWYTCPKCTEKIEVINMTENKKEEVKTEKKEEETRVRHLTIKYKASQGKSIAKFFVENRIEFEFDK